MYVVFCKIDHCIHIHWCIVMGLGHNDPWVESHMWPQQTWGQRSSRDQWPLVQVFGKKGQCIHMILWCIFKSNITMIAKVCDRESRRDTWFENRPVLFIDCSKMARIRINTRTHTKEKPYLINSYFFSKLVRQKKSIRWAKYVCLCEWDMCWRNFCNFSLMIKKCEKVKNSPFFKWAPFWNLISKKENNYAFLK